MTNAEIFQWVGRFATDFLLSLFGYNPYSIAPDLYQALVIILSIIIWLWIIRILAAIFKKAFGFGRNRGGYQ